MLRLRSSTAVAVLAWASALHAADPLPIEPAPAPAPVPAQAPGANAPGTVQAFPPIEALPDPAAQAEPAPLPAPLEPPKEEKPSAPDRVSTGKNGGFFQPLALLQIWGVATHVENQKTTSTFRLRRAELGAKGEILPKLLTYRVVFDLAKTPTFTTSTSQVPVTAADGGPSPGTVAVSSAALGADRSTLQDAYMTYLSDYADVTIGQFKIPVSLQALQSNAKLLFPERSRVTREYGDRRDIGIRVDKKIADVFYYNVGLFNGQGQSVTDADRAKDLALRLEAYPIPGLTVGGLAYGTVAAGNGVARNRVEGDVRLELADLIVQGEYIHAWTGPKTRRLEGHGAYGEVAYLIAGQFQPAARIGFLDTNTNNLKPASISETGVQEQYELGLNYLVKGGVYDGKLTAAFAYYSQEHGPDTSELTLQAQATF